MGLTESIQSLQYFARMESAFCRPLAECDTKTKSSAYSKQFNFEPLGNVMESVSFRSSKKGISFKYKVKEYKLVVHLSGSQKILSFYQRT